MVERMSRWLKMAHNVSTSKHLPSLLCTRRPELVRQSSALSRAQSNRWVVICNPWTDSKAGQVRVHSAWGFSSAAPLSYSTKCALSRSEFLEFTH